MEELASTLQVCFDAGPKKVLIPMVSASDMSTVPPALFAKLQISFYQTAESQFLRILEVE